MIFWGYNNEKEARQSWPNLDEGQKIVNDISVCSREVHCTGSLDGQTYMYDNGSTDKGKIIKIATVIIGNNKIRYEL